MADAAAEGHAGCIQHVSKLPDVFCVSTQLVLPQALSEALSHKVMREARAQQDELDAEDMPEGAIPQVRQCLHHFLAPPMPAYCISAFPQVIAWFQRGSQP